MFFTYLSRPYRHNYYVNCTLTLDIGPFKKGQHIDVIYNKQFTTTFTVCTKYESYSISLRKLIRIHSAARKIQSAWRRCISDPSYKICIKRLLNEYKLDECVPKEKIGYEHVSFDFDLSPESPEIYDKPLMSIRERIRLARNREDYEPEPELEPELPFPLGKNIYM